MGGGEYHHSLGFGWEVLEVEEVKVQGKYTVQVLLIRFCISRDLL